MPKYSCKDFVVWYKSGSGGFFVSWLLQVALTPSSLRQALDVFPTTLTVDASSWKTFEKTPDNVGVLCNMFHPDSYYTIDLRQETNLTLDNLVKEDYSFDNLLHCRIKYYLVNYVFQSGHIPSNSVDTMQSYLRECQLAADSDYIRHTTNVICDPSKAIFVIAPENYIRASSDAKKCRYYLSPVNQILSERSNLNTFYLNSVWKQSWIEEIEKVMSSKLTTIQIDACQELVSRYMQIMPENVRLTCT